MKGITRFLLVVLILCFLAGCKTNTESFHDPVSFYYRTNSDTFNAGESILTAEMRESAPHHKDIVKILNDYFSGPISDAMTSPFPADLIALSFTSNDNIASIVLSDSFYNLNGLDHSIACAALTMTVYELTNCDALDIFVQINANEIDHILTLSVDDLYFLDHTESKS